MNYTMTEAQAHRYMAVAEEGGPHGEGIVAAAATLAFYDNHAGSYARRHRRFQKEKGACRTYEELDALDTRLCEEECRGLEWALKAHYGTFTATKP